MASLTSKNKVNEEVQINHEDQKMINAFANKNAKYNEFKSNFDNKKKELQNLQDAGDDLLMVDSEMIPIHIGEVFLYLNMEDTENFIEATKEQIEKEVEGYELRMKQYETELKDLKVKLYAKFGSSINLEDDEEN